MMNAHPTGPMRALVAVAIILVSSSAAHSEGRRSKQSRSTQSSSKQSSSKPSSSKQSRAKQSRARQSRSQRAAMKAKRVSAAKRFHPSRVLIRSPGAQSYGAPWNGFLRNSAQLPDGEGYFIRRPQRSFATRATVDFVKSALATVREQFPDSHVLAIGDLSAKSGGPITGHRSHQSGRDVDVGLIYKAKPDGFPNAFAPATDDNLDCEATYALINEFANTSKDGGVQVIFLDFDVQRMLYDWALAQGEDFSELQKLLQFPNRGSRAALVQHAPNHHDHLHVRFRCANKEPNCSH